MLILAAPAPLWRTIDQPVALKGLVAMVGLLLIAWQLWWFLGRHGGGVAARESEAGLQEITIIVDGGYAPSRITVKAGQPMRLAFHRIDPSSCVAQGPDRMRLRSSTRMWGNRPVPPAVA